MSDIREKLAELEHEQWVKWSSELVDKEKLSTERVERWKTMWIPYDKLTDEQKDQDREWADKVLAVFNKGEIEKSFSSAKNLTEGANAYQQYDMENKDRIGSSTSPIEIEEPPVSVKKNISTMAPKEQIGENGADKEIKFDNPEDKIKKDYSGGVAFSTQHQIPGEMSNQISAPEKVNATVENRKRSDVTNNREPYFEKMSDADFFKSIDDFVFEEETESSASNILESMEQHIHSDLKTAIKGWLGELSIDTDMDDAMVSVKKLLLKWQKDSSMKVASDFYKLAGLGVVAGARMAKIPTSVDSIEQACPMSSKGKGLTCALQNLANKIFIELSREIKSQKMGSYKQRRAIDSIIKNLHDDIKMAIKTEVAILGKKGANAASNDF